MRFLSRCGVVVLLAAFGAGSLAPAGAQQGGGGNGQGNGGNGNGSGLHPIVPRDIDAIFAFPPDNSLIVHDPPSELPKGPPTVIVRAQCLEVLRNGGANAVKRFKTIDSPEVVLTQGLKGVVRVKTPTKVVEYQMKAAVESDGTVTMTLYAPGEEVRILEKLEKKDAVKLGESVVVSGVIAPQGDGGQKESYLQFTFSLPEKPAEKSAEKTAEAARATAPAAGGPAAPPAKAGAGERK